MADDYSDEDKPCYLQDSLKDAEAVKIVKDAIANGDEYSVVVGRPKKVLDKPREVYLRAVKAILKIGQLTMQAYPHSPQNF